MLRFVIEALIDIYLSTCACSFMYIYNKLCLHVINTDFNNKMKLNRRELHEQIEKRHASFRNDIIECVRWRFNYEMRLCLMLMP